MWEIGRQVVKTLDNIGNTSIGQLARFPLELFEDKFGIIGNQLFHHEKKGFGERLVEHAERKEALEKVDMKHEEH